MLTNFENCKIVENLKYKTECKISIFIGRQYEYVKNFQHFSTRTLRWFL